ncbi:transposon Ty3-I Gag-Pol polyprotein [Trichonephila clavipes]|nr:transposon Ty3-I Gag-Pol polyprotein [Trichonephila clavipes]
MNDVGAVKIPAYNFHDPALWFTMCDSTFQLGCPKAITDSKTKFNYIIAHLPPEAATIIRDVIMNPDPVEPAEKSENGANKKEAVNHPIKKSGNYSSENLADIEKAAEVADRVMEVTPIAAIVEFIQLKTVSGDSVYHELLRKFPDITKPPRPDQEIKHSVVHYIETNSRPVTAKARRLAPDRSPHRKSGI